MSVFKVFDTVPEPGKFSGDLANRRVAGSLGEVTQRRLSLASEEDSRSSDSKPLAAALPCERLEVPPRKIVLEELEPIADVASDLVRKFAELLSRLLGDEQFVSYPGDYSGSFMSQTEPVLSRRVKTMPGPRMAMVSPGLRSGSCPGGKRTGKGSAKRRGWRSKRMAISFGPSK